MILITCPGISEWNCYLKDMTSLDLWMVLHHVLHSFLTQTLVIPRLILKALIFGMSMMTSRFGRCIIRLLCSWLLPPYLLLLFPVPLETPILKICGIDLRSNSPKSLKPVLSRCNSCWKQSRRVMILSFSVCKELGMLGIVYLLLGHVLIIMILWFPPWMDCLLNTIQLGILLKYKKL